MKNSKISWCHDTVNFWWGCTEARDENDKMRPACVHCYARETDRRYGVRFDGQRHWGDDAPRWLRVEKAMAELQSNDSRAAVTGRRRQFINSMSDFFEDRRDLDMPRLQALSMFRQLKNVDILLLTKHPGSIMHLLGIVHNIAADQEYWDDGGALAVWLWDWLHSDDIPQHIWVGTTIENQAVAEIEIPKLLSVPAALHWISAEPLFGELQIRKWLPHKERTFSERNLHRPFIGWVVAGGESGQKRRVLELDHLKSLGEQCAVDGVPFFVKQDSHALPGIQGRIPDELWGRKEFPEVRAGLAV